MRPADSDYPPFYSGYISQVPESDIVPVLEAQVVVLRRLTTAVSPAQETYAYAPGKWSIREVVGHLGDAERVFSFRAFSFSRSESASLPGFEENAYVGQARFADVTLADLVEELALLRAANLRMLGRLDEAQWTTTGIANGKPVTVRALAFVMAGHVRHHFRILRERYGVDVGN